LQTFADAPVSDSGIIRSDDDTAMPAMRTCRS
jgi:hypothetical protein